MEIIKDNPQSSFLAPFAFPQSGILCRSQNFFSFITPVSETFIPTVKRNGLSLLLAVGFRPLFTFVKPLRSLSAIHLCLNKKSFWTLSGESRGNMSEMSNRVSTWVKTFMTGDWKLVFDACLLISGLCQWFSL